MFGSEGIFLSFTKEFVARTKLGGTRGERLPTSDSSSTPPV